MISISPGAPLDGWLCCFPGRARDHIAIHAAFKSPARVKNGQVKVKGDAVAHQTRIAQGPGLVADMRGAFDVLKFLGKGEMNGIGSGAGDHFPGAFDKMVRIFLLNLDIFLIYIHLIVTIWILILLYGRFLEQISKAV